jgi:tetratricopeptide (TPR) repeat protein
MPFKAKHMLNLINYPMKKLYILTLFVCFLNIYGFAQGDKNNQANRITSIEEQQKTDEADIQQSKDDINKIDNSTTNEIKSYKEDTKFLINLYVAFITGGLLFIGFLINFFGRDAIKKRVEEIISETAQKHIETKIVDTLNNKLTSELIEEIIKSKSQAEITRILNNIESQGNNLIEDLKTKGQEAIKALAGPPIQPQLNNSNPSALEITQRNDALRSNEFFNIAFNSTDPRIQISLYKNVLEIQPRNVSALNNIGIAYNKLNEIENAIETLTKVINLDPRFYLAYVNRADTYILKEDLLAALSDIDKAIELAPNFDYSYVIKSKILKKQNKLVESENILIKAIEVNPASAEANYNLGFYYEQVNEFSKSFEYYEKATKLGFKNMAMLNNNMAVLFRRQKEFDKAIEYIEKAREINSNFQNLDGTLALIHADKNDDENFYKYLQLALEKGCKAWEYLEDPGFNKYRDSDRLRTLITTYKNKYFA